MPHPHQGGYPDRPKAMCQPSESYSDVILRLKSAHC